MKEKSLAGLHFILSWDSKKNRISGDDWQQTKAITKQELGVASQTMYVLLVSRGPDQKKKSKIKKGILWKSRVWVYEKTGSRVNLGDQTQKKKKKKKKTNASNRQSEKEKRE